MANPDADSQGHRWPVNRIMQRPKPCDCRNAIRNSKRETVGGENDDLYIR